MASYRMISVIIISVSMYEYWFLNRMSTYLHIITSNITIDMVKHTISTAVASGQNLTTADVYHYEPSMYFCLGLLTVDINNTRTYNVMLYDWIVFFCDIHFMHVNQILNVKNIIVL